VKLQQLSVFREVMATGSVSQAARRLGRTQPAISLSLRELEASLGITLFEREGRRLIPVPEAYYLLAEADEVLDRLSTVSRTMKSLGDAASGNLKVAAMPGPSSYLFPGYISRVLGDFRDIKLTLTMRSSQQILELVATQSIDFGFADLDFQLEKRKGLLTAETFSARCFCALPQAHPLAQKAALSWEDLHDQPMGGLHSAHWLQKRIHMAFQGHGARYNQIIESQFFIPLLQFVSQGQCCAIVDPMTVASEQQSRLNGDALVFRPLAQDLRYDCAIFVPRLRPMSQLARRVKDGWKAEVLRLMTVLGADPMTDIYSNE
jgi:DNA-binding transcriptional LysR family regulator|tara:strand:+ start:254 stop:1210 length:957 start_codon:yes stop_codon:yes gene_type:complete